MTIAWIAITLAALVLAAPCGGVAVAAPKPEVFDPHGKSEARFVAETEQRLDVSAHDGVALHVRLFRPVTTPAVPGWKAPVILIHSPYFDSIDPELPSHRDLKRRYVPRGYAVAFASVRGTGRSGGCLDLDGPNQSRDFKTLVEHFARQPWSNGRVGSYGLSYDGEAQFAGARLKPVGLEAMVTMEAISGLYDFGYLDGVPLKQSDSAFVPYIRRLDDFLFYPGTSVGTLHLGSQECQLANARAGLDLSGDITPYHAAREFRLGVEDIRPAVLYVQSLRDPIVRPLNSVGFFDELPGFKRAVIGNWPEHALPYPNMTSADGDNYANDEFAREDWFDMVDAWFDRFLLRLDTDVESWPRVQIQDEDNVWREVRSIRSMGLLRRYTLGHDSLGTAARSDPSVAFAEQTGAKWLGDALPARLHLSGQPVLDARISLDRDDGHFAVALQEQKSDGTVRTLAAGYLSARHRPLSLHPTRAGLTGEPGSAGNEGPVPIGVARAYRMRPHRAVDRATSR